jgi:hypothetical protein
LPIRAATNFLGGIVLLAAILYFAAEFATADSRVWNLCRKITPGMSVSDLNAYADRVGLGPPARPTGTSFVVEKKTLGRYGCRIETAEETVRSAKYDVSN